MGGSLQPAGVAADGTYDAPEGRFLKPRNGAAIDRQDTVAQIRAPGAAGQGRIRLLRMRTAANLWEGKPEGAKVERQGWPEWGGCRNNGSGS